MRCWSMTARLHATTSATSSAIWESGTLPRHKTANRRVRLSNESSSTLIVTDYNMPEMDGREFTEFVRTRSGQSSVPILMVSSEQNRNRFGSGAECRCFCAVRQAVRPTTGARPDPQAARVTMNNGPFPGHCSITRYVTEITAHLHCLPGMRQRLPGWRSCLSCPCSSRLDKLRRFSVNCSVRPCGSFRQRCDPTADY